MKYLLAVLGCLFLLTCTSPPPDNRLDITLQNATEREITIRARMGLFGRSIRLQPGAVWEGWVLRNLAGREILIQVEQKKKQDREETVSR